MSDKKRLFLLIEYFSDPNSYDFENPIGNMIKDCISDEDMLIVLDNLSDGMTVQQTNNLITDDRVVTVINYFQEDVASLGKASSTLNAAIKMKAIFYSNRENKSLAPMMRFAKGKYYKNEADLRELLF